MKIARLLFIAAILLVSSQQASGQVRAKARSFYILTGIGGYSAHTDSIVIESQVADTIYFYSLDLASHKKDRYVQRGSLVTDSAGNFLFDYNLVVGQKLYFTEVSHLDSFLVDSITYTWLGQSLYKTWHLHLLDTTLPFRFSWTQCFGSLNYGWYYGNYRAADIGHIRKSICADDSLLYWDSTFNGFEPNHPDPTCDYPLLQHLLSNKEVDMGEGLKIFPVPASGFITIESPSSGAMTLFDLQGRALMSQAVQSGLQQFNINTLQSGTYWITIHTEQFTCSRKLVISR